MKTTDTLANVQKAAHDYTLATSIDCFYIPIHGKNSDQIQANDQESVIILAGTCETDGGQDLCCRFCGRIEKRCGLHTQCKETHQFAGYQSERFGGKYHYFCQLSLLHWASPIIRGGMLQGALISGPARIFETDDFYFDECGKKFSLDKQQVEIVAEELEGVPVISTARANSLSDILFLLSLSLSDNDARTFFADRQAFEQQSRIGEYLQYLKTMEGDKRSDFYYPMEKEKQLLKYATAGNKKEAELLLDEILGTVLYTTGVRVDMVKSRILELSVLLSRAAVEGGADVEQIFGLNYHYLIQIRELDTIEELTQWTLRIMDRFIDLVFNLRDVQHTHKILQAIRYVKQHFQEKISLQNTADSVHLSPSYFSKLFKLEMRTTFSEYLNDFRIEEAKKLLLSTELHLGDVGFECGFEDQSYFTKVFKKSVGIAPSRYRNTGGRVVRAER
ncbi:MAG: AraC family transcriptional regulator [Bacteroidetes bacterium]|nr:AraC family transcriptional regulator [Bacteroidota bacterium]